MWFLPILLWLGMVTAVLFWKIGRDEAKDARHDCDPDHHSPFRCGDRNESTVGPRMRRTDVDL